MTKIIDDYWGSGGNMNCANRFHAILEVYPTKDLRIQLQELSKNLEEVLENKDKTIIKEELEALCEINKEVKKLLSQKEIRQNEFDFIAQLVFEGAKMPRYAFLGLS